MARFLGFKAAEGEAKGSSPSPPSTPASPRAAKGDAGNALLAFQTEGIQTEKRDVVASRATAAPAAERQHRRMHFGVVTVGVAIAAAVAAAVSVAVYVRFKTASHITTSPAATPATGTATIDSHPPGLVTIDGIARGSTPLVVSLPVGAHAMEIAAGNSTRSLPLVIEAGTVVKQDVEFSADVSAEVGQLDVSSEPLGSQVTIDGTARGVTPLKLGTMTPGEHRVVITRGATTIRQTVNIVPGATASIAASMVEADSAGWVTLKSAVGLDVLEDGQIIGTTAASRLMLPAGAHKLELRSAAFEVGTTLSVQIAAGKTLSVTVPLPNGLLSINALPWANVSVDGRDVGTTPLANLSVPVGTHEIVWQNPQLGERRGTVDVKAHAPARAGVDFTR